MIKTCARCGCEFDAHHFNVKYCDDCRPIVKREQNREARRRWLKANPEKQRECVRRWEKANPEKQREYQRRWRKAHPEYGRQRYIKSKLAVLRGVTRHENH